MATKNEYVVAIQSTIRFGGYKKNAANEYLLNVEGRKFGEISVGRQNLFSTQTEVHDYGCRTAAVINAERRRSVVAAGQSWEDDKHRQYYVGSYRMLVKRIMEAGTAKHSLTVYYHPIDDLPEHCNIEIVVQEGDATKKQLSHDMTDVIAALQSILKDPNQHICQYDLDSEALLSRISLEVPVNSSVATLNPPSRKE